MSDKIHQVEGLEHTLEGFNTGWFGGAGDQDIKVPAQWVGDAEESTIAVVTEH